MATIYRQQPVTVLRTAKEGDPDWDATCEGEQVLIKNGDGTETVAPKDQVVGATTIKSPTAPNVTNPPKAQDPKQVEPAKPADTHTLKPSTSPNPKFK